MLAERDLGRNNRSSRQTVGQYLDHWLSICARPRLRAKSFRDYVALMARYVRPRLGERRLGELSSVELQALYGELLNRKLSVRTICYTHAVLFSAMRQAVRWKFLLTNPAEDVHLPRQPRRSFTVFDVKDTRQFIAAISGHEYEALFALAITTGMRPSEYLALTWSDLDLERGTVSVSKTLVWRERRWYFEDTKRERGRRMIKLQNWVLALLRRSSEKASSTGLKPSDLVFTSNRGGPIHEAKLVWRHFKPLLVSAGLPNIRLYDLRLTAATLAVTAGVSPKIISEQLGHASVVFTLEVYSQAAAVYAATKGSKEPVYVSPFVGRLDDVGEDGMDLVKNIKKMFEHSDGHVHVLAASIRNLNHLLFTFALEAELATVPTKVLEEWAANGFPMPDRDFRYQGINAGGTPLKTIPYEPLDLDLPWQRFSIGHELTDKGIQNFVADYQGTLRSQA